MKGYWVNHILEVKDAERFTAYAEAAQLICPILNNSYQSLNPITPVPAVERQALNSTRLDPVRIAAA